MYSACLTVLRVAPESRTPPQAGQRMFQDISKIPSRAPCRKAAITSSSLSLCLAAKARALIRRRSRSGAVLDELFDRAYRLRLRRFSQSIEESVGFAGKFHVTIRLITVAVTVCPGKRKASDRCAKPFLSPMDLDKDGNVYVADSNNFVIRKIAPDGSVTTMAGQAGKEGTTDGEAKSARFSFPSGVAFDGKGNLYVVDRVTVRRIDARGMVTTLAGSPNQEGSTDGTGSSALFRIPKLSPSIPQETCMWPTMAIRTSASSHPAGW